MAEGKFFFEEDTAVPEDAPVVEDTPNEDSQFVGQLKAAGVVREAEVPDSVMAEAQVKTHKTKLVEISYGNYQGNYAVHVTPVHPRKHLSSDDQVNRAVRALAITLNEYVAPALQVNLHLPRSDWQMKVISAVILEGNNSFQFRQEKFEEVGVLDLASAIEKICME